MMTILPWLVSCYFFTTSLFLMAQSQSITDVHIVFSCHLDVGYTDTAANVINKYFNTYYPAAIQTAQQLRQRGGEERLIFTTHPWLLSLYFDCENASIPDVDGVVTCPTDTARQDLFEAIQRGDIVYHAFPFNGQNELLEPSLFQAALNIAKRLDTFFGRNQTITMSQRDVPGITRSAVPHLYDAGIKAISVGVNSGSAPAAVPKAFLWTEPSTNKSIIGMWHPGGYGGIGVDDCVIVKGFSHALAFAWRGDNDGPPGLNEVLSNFATLKNEFPGAKIYASTFDNFVNALEPNKNLLPVVTEEIGDTWIIFQAADPLKQVYLREIQRARVECIAAKQCNPDDPDFARFDRLLVKISEHTGSVDDTKYLQDYSNWSNEQFEKVIDNTKFQFMLKSFLEQRQFMYNAIGLLKNSAFAQQLQKRLGALFPKIPSTTGFTMATSITQKYQCQNVAIGFSPTGAITYLYDTLTQIDWSSANNPIGEYSYITYSADDYTNWLKKYSYCSDIYASNCDWVLYAHGKYNLSEANPKHNVFMPEVTSLWYSPNQCEFLVNMNMTDPTSYQTYGGAQNFWTHFIISPDSKGSIYINITFQWFEKTRTRLPESHWFSFKPQIYEFNPKNWMMDKLGYLVSPLDVVLNGSHNLHGINPLSGIIYDDGHYNIILRSLDIPMVSPGNPSALPDPNGQPDLTLGWHYLLLANIWGTNWPEWYPFVSSDDASLFRFQAELHIK